MAGFLFRLERADGTPAELPTLHSAVPNWRAGDTIPFGYKTLRVVGVRDDDADQAPVRSSRTWPDKRLAPGSRSSGRRSARRPGLRFPAEDHLFQPWAERPIDLLWPASKALVRGRGTIERNDTGAFDGPSATV